MKTHVKKTEELVVNTNTYDVILWSFNHTSRFPRQHQLTYRGAKAGDHSGQMERGALG